MKRSEIKQLQLNFILQCIETLPETSWGDCSGDDYFESVTMLTAENVKSVISWGYKSPESEYMNLIGTKYDLIDFIRRNANQLSSYEHIPTNSQYDCTGKVCSRSLQFDKFRQYDVIVTRTATLDV